MNREQMVFEMMKAIAPTIVHEGLDMQHRLHAAGQNPEDCVIEGKDIPHAYGESARIWAGAFVDEFIDRYAPNRSEW